MKHDRLQHSSVVHRARFKRCMGPQQLAAAVARVFPTDQAQIAEAAPTHWRAVD